jgi:hypothetical protein
VAWFVGMKMTHSAAGLFVGLLVSTAITAVTQVGHPALHPAPSHPL